MKIGVVADDITGANDIGSMFANGGYVAHVYAHDSFDPTDVWSAGERPDVCIIDTNSRLDEFDVAYAKVHSATQQLQQIGCEHFFNKTCSVFRGNIGAEFDAMLDALGEEFAVVVLGFPKNGRTTVDGVHRVHGERLEDSPFRNDPIHPTTRSDLVTILQAQTRRKVALIDHHVIEQGVDALRRCIKEMKDRCNYVILDVPDQSALRTIAQGVSDQRVLCGSSALAEELPAVWGAARSDRRRDTLPHFGTDGTLCAAGSLTPQTRAQIEHLRSLDLPAAEIDTLCIFDDDARQDQIDRAINLLSQPLERGQPALVYGANNPEVVAGTRAEGARRGLQPTAVARLVEQMLAEIVARTLERTASRRLVVAGGETSAAICRRLGVHGMRIWREIQPGLPSCVTLTDPPLLLVLKSGSFGTADFLEQAIAHMQSQ